MIIGQGQLDTVLNARPEDRRADHRGGGGRAQAPPPPGAGRAPAGRHGREPRAPRRPGARGAPPDPPARAPGRRRPLARHAWRPSCGPSAATWPAPSWPTLRPARRARRRSDLAVCRRRGAPSCTRRWSTLDAEAAVDRGRAVARAARRTWPTRSGPGARGWSSGPGA